ncbi:M13 family metallopeptidase [soil metagenome]
MISTSPSISLRALALGAGLAVALGGFALAQAGDLTKVNSLGPWGVDLSAGDKSVKPGDDFYRAIVGTWTDKLVIPADRTRWGSFDELRELSDARSRAVIEKAAATKGAKGEAAQIGAFYRSYMDEKTVEALDAKPLTADLAAIRAAGDHDKLGAMMGKATQGFQSSFFNFGINDDQKVPNRYAVDLNQGGLGLPDRDYYLEARFAKEKAAYQAYVAQTLKAIAWPGADARAADIVAMETEIAKASWTRTERRDDTKMYNATKVADLAKLAPGFPWAGFMKSARLEKTDRVIVHEVTAFPKIADIFAKAPVPTLQAWMAYNVADNAAPFLSKRFVDAAFEFHGKTLSGQPEQRPRWKRAVTSVGNTLGEGVGKLYVAAYFPPAYKAQMVSLVSNLKVSMKGRIEHADWMSPATKTEALTKLSKLGVKIGYPDKWRDYSKLVVKDGDLYGNVARGVAFDWDFRAGRLNGPIDRSEWGMFPQTVNAYYDPAKNEVVFPAAILQPPFFDPNADLAVNYGGIGAVIGHEITHAFDDQGRQSDGDGQLRDWWTAADAAKFKVQADKLGAQYSAFEPLPGAHIKGDLTMGENIADLGGILMAFDAYHNALGGKPAPSIDGLTGDQRFFYGFAQIWRGKIRDDQLRQQLVTDPHSPQYYRVNGVVHNVDAWYTAFAVPADAKLAVKPADRVRIW